jgi:hypothetical protein
VGDSGYGPTPGEWPAMDVELKRDAKGVIDQIVNLRDSL